MSSPRSRIAATIEAATSRAPSDFAGRLPRASRLPAIRSPESDGYHAVVQSRIPAGKQRRFESEKSSSATRRIETSAKMPKESKDAHHASSGLLREMTECDQIVTNRSSPNLIEPR